MSEVIKDFNCYIKANKVDDIIPKGIDCLLILESPHKKEFENNLPLVGRTGELVSDFSKRLKNVLLKNSELRILVCGGFAQSYVNYVKKDIEEMQKLTNQILFVAHPSRNAWCRLDNEESKGLKNYGRCI